MIPVRDVIVVERVVKKKTEGGLHIPDAFQGDDDRGVVVAIGPGVYHADTKRFLPVCAVPAKLPPMPNGEQIVIAGIRLGDTVVFHKRGGFEFTHEGRKLLALRPEELACILPAKKE